MENCLFCKITRKEISTTIIFEDDDLMVFPDINPINNTHWLLVPKKHIESIKTLDETQGDDQLIAKLFLTARDLAKEHNLKGYKVNFNVGKTGGQEIMHLHLHISSVHKAKL